MMTYTSEFYTSDFQEKYNKFIDELEPVILKCACGMAGQLIRHGFYNRSVLLETGKLKLSILRLKCKHCKKTHAVLPSWIVPYSQILLIDHVDILRQFEKGGSPYSIDPANGYVDRFSIVYITKQYLRYWKQRLLSERIDLFSDLALVVTKCFDSHQRQFMQIKRTFNSLFS